MLKRDLMSFSLYPTYLLIKSEEETEKKVPSASVAQALAKYVFPVPGGPYKRIPFQGLRLPVKISLNRIGKMTAYFKAFLAFYSPETSSHLIFGFSVTIASLIWPFKLLSSLPPLPPPLFPPPPPVVVGAIYRIISTYFFAFFSIFESSSEFLQLAFVPRFHLLDRFVINDEFQHRDTFSELDQTWFNIIATFLAFVIVPELFRLL